MYVPSFLTLRIKGYEMYIGDPAGDSDRGKSEAEVDAMSMNSILLSFAESYMSTSVVID